MVSAHCGAVMAENVMTAPFFVQIFYDRITGKPQAYNRLSFSILE